MAQSDDIGTPALFGGQALGQALMAASLMTVPADRMVHSLRLRCCRASAPVTYSEVDRVRDGRSFSMRSVVQRARATRSFLN